MRQGFWLDVILSLGSRLVELPLFGAGCSNRGGRIVTCIRMLIGFCLQVTHDSSGHMHRPYQAWWPYVMSWGWGMLLHPVLG